MSRPIKSVDNPIRDSMGRFLPGNVANPAGRPPKESCFKNILDLIVEESPGKDGKTNFELVSRKLVEMALGGDLGAIRELMDRVLGRPGIWADLHLSNESPVGAVTVLSILDHLRERDNDN